jgi:hypothetical protein
MFLGGAYLLDVHIYSQGWMGLRDILLCISACTDAYLGIGNHSLLFSIFTYTMNHGKHEIACFQDNL